MNVLSSTRPIVVLSTANSCERPARLALRITSLGIVASQSDYHHARVQVKRIVRFIARQFSGENIRPEYAKRIPNRTCRISETGILKSRPLKCARLQPTEPDHYAALGLDTRCTDAQIRAAYRLLARQHHPDVNPDSPDAMAQTQAINVAYEILSDPARRRAYDNSRRKKKSVRAPNSKSNLSQDVHLRIEEFLRGATLEVRVNDPANPGGTEIYPLIIPPATAPGTRIRLERSASPSGGFVRVRLRAAPHFRFKVRGSDLRCDLRIHFRRAMEGGEEMVSGGNGARLRVRIPKGVARGEIIRIFGEGLPKPRGDRGDLLVRIVYQPQVRVARVAK